MNGMSGFWLMHDFKNTSFVGNNVKPSFWQRASALVLCTGRSNVNKTTMLTMCSSFELELGYIISTKTSVLGTQKNRLNETVVLSIPKHVSTDGIRK